MTQFFMHLRHADDLMKDSEGSMLPDLEAAKEEARASANELVADQIKHGQVINDQSFEIWSDGELRATVDFFEAINHP